MCLLTPETIGGWRGVQEGERGELERSRVGPTTRDSRLGEGAQKEVNTSEWFSNASSQGFGTQHVGISRVPASFSVAQGTPYMTSVPWIWKLKRE